MAIKYEITRKGMGFQDRHALSKRRALIKIRRRVRRLTGPYRIEGDANGVRYNLDGVMKFIRLHIDNLKPHERLVIEGDYYDQPKWVIKAVDVGPVTGSMIMWGQQFIGKSPYELGANGPPGPSDCSGLTSADILAVYNATVEHNAELQRQDETHFSIFHDATDLRKDDLMFFNYGRLPWPQADHVEFVDNPGSRNLGSRPSTNGVAWYNLATWDRDNIVAFGRLRDEFKKR